MEKLIKHPHRASQVLDFGGMLEPPYAPTDIDGLIEWKDKAYIIIECKYKQKEMSKGQQIAIERMINDFVKAGKRALAIVVEHDEDNIERSVMVADQLVRQVYFDTQRKWREPNYICTAREVVNDFIKYVEGGNKNV